MDTIEQKWYILNLIFTGHHDICQHFARPLWSKLLESPWRIQSREVHRRKNKYFQAERTLDTFFYWKKILLRSKFGRKRIFSVLCRLVAKIHFRSSGRRTIAKDWTRFWSYCGNSARSAALQNRFKEKRRQQWLMNQNVVHPEIDFVRWQMVLRSVL